MPLNPLYTCSRCKKEFNFNNIKYDEHKSLICAQCLEKKQKLERKEELQSGKANSQETINFICVSCRFKFSVKKGSQKAIKCPYCGKTRLMLVKKYKDENDLIRDSTDPRFDY